MARIDINEQLEEMYKEIKPYLDNEDEFPMLYKMCEACGLWCGNEHDYSECREKPCFKFFLGYAYLKCANSYDEVRN